MDPPPPPHPPTLDSSEAQFKREWPDIHRTYHRVMWPRLRPLPLESISVEESSSFRSKEDMISVAVYRTIRICSSIRLFDCTVSIVYRQIPGNPFAAIPTLLITAPWGDDRSSSLWPLIVSHCVLILQRHVPDRRVYIEMMAPEMLRPVHVSPPPQNPHLVNEWPLIRDRIYQRLEAFEATRSHVTAITLMRRGYRRDHSFNPITVFIAMAQESDQKQWREVLNDIHEHMGDIGWDTLHVHMEHGVCEKHTLKAEMPLGARPDLRNSFERNRYVRREYREIARPGDSIASSCSFDGKPAPSATLSCFVQITIKGSVVKCALTSYQVARSGFNGYRLSKDMTVEQDAQTQFSAAETQWMNVLRVEEAPKRDSDLWKVDQHGYWTNRDKTISFPARMESPSRLTHDFSLACLEEDIRLFSKEASGSRHSYAENLKNQRDEMMAFFDRGYHRLDGIFGCSGNRQTDDKNRLDWALVSAHQHRTGPNVVPGRSHLFPSLLLYSGLCRCGWNPHCVMTSPITLKHPSPDHTIRRMPTGTRLWKVGHASDTTAGTLSSYRSLCRVGGKISLEYVVFGGAPDCRLRVTNSSAFAKPGDSGAVVVGKQGEVVGLLTAGQKPQNNSTGYVFVTPIEDIFSDMVRHSRGKITDIRIVSE
ncbi:hypothetical protein F66182_5162 [Fusarium sp. NRRL 66182]|nr:hypothetical protein F66182_5162 [Fusarium sp. NRRL 66182]